MSGIGDDARPGQQAEPRDGQAAPPGGAHDIEGIRSLHERIDELQRAVTQGLAAEGMHADSWLHGHAGGQHRPGQAPAWRRRTKGEARWQVTLCVAVGIALQIMVPGRLVTVALVVARAVNILH